MLRPDCAGEMKGGRERELHVAVSATEDVDMEGERATVEEPAVRAAVGNKDRIRRTSLPPEELLGGRTSLTRPRPVRRGSVFIP